ncbi:MAG: tetratricopeptide repeat protein [Nitrospirota bacterium]
MEKEFSEIGKLTERISKDPKSKLFVPLAEEYKKTGDLEMAIHVLSEGLKNNPGYITARSILGRLLFEKGDLEGSQKELEEVVKAIPDNLLAQRKLGDICILQHRPDEALKHYKSALLLNPLDPELTALVSNLEAGKDTGSPVSEQKPLPVKRPVSPEPKPATKPEEKPVSPAVPVQTAPADPKSKVAEVPPEKPKAEVSEVSSEKQTEAAAVPALDEQPSDIKTNEEPEEIFLVEPLDQEKTDSSHEAVTLDFLKTEPNDTEPVAAESIEDKQQPDSSTDDLRMGFQELLKEADAVVGKDAEIADPFSETETMQGASSEISDSSDDFTTDTLAELYIAQGFYEKAIDIYERMLADKPNSQGLKSKLEAVRAAAASSPQPAFGEQTKQTDIFSEPQAYRASEERPEHSDVSVSEPSPVSLENQEDEIQIIPDGPEFSRTQPPYTDFEPREYVPPDAEPIEIKREPEPVPEKAQETVTLPHAIRKETITRLESWLKNIKKER